MITVAILTISDGCARNEREDISGRTIEQMLPRGQFDAVARGVVPDDRREIASKLMTLADIAAVDLVLTTGGTGFGPRDVTPEATTSVCERMVPGLCEVMRVEGFKRTANAVLSRAVAGIRGRTLIVNLPGSPRAVRECLEIILDVLPHAVKMLHGEGHP